MNIIVMRKLFVIIILIFYNIFLFSQNVKYKNNLYSILSDNAVALKLYQVDKKDLFNETLSLDSVVIHKKKKYRVVKIEETAFKSNSSATLIHLNYIKRLILPLTLCEISPNVFNESFNSLQEITIHRNTKVVGNNAFANMPSLTRIDVKGISEINDWCFSLNPSLSFVLFDTCVNIIGKNAFFNCTRLNTVNLENVSFIDEYAFEGTAIEILNIKNCVTIGEFAFANCRNINTVEFSNSLHRIGGFAFYNNTALKSLNISSGIIGESAFMGCTSLTNVLLSDSVDSIAKAAFFGCTALNDINIPSSITRIEAMTFMDCINLNSVVLPDSLKYIGESAFAGSGLSEIVIPASVSEIHNNAFVNCAKLKTVIILSDNIKIGDSVFPENTNILRK